MGLLTVISSASFGTVIFSGDLSSALPMGIGLLLFSSAAISTIVASFSAYPTVVATVSDTTIPVLGLVARQVVALMPHASDQAKFLTVAATILFNSIAVGTILMALGWFKLGGLIRFIPYPVVGGFLAGTGVLLLQGAYNSLNNVNYDQLTLSVFLEPSVLFQWLPAVLFAGAMFVLPRFIDHFLLLPGIIAVSIAIFYLGLALTGTSIETANTQGLLLGTIPPGELFHISTIPSVQSANWGVVFAQIPSLAALWLIESIALLLNANGIELLAGRDFDLNRELKIAGAASIVSGVGGGISGFSSVGETTFAKHLGGNGRLVGWTIAAICLVMALGNAAILSYFPKFILVGIPLLLGIDFFYDWIYRAWFKFSRSDYCIILLIVLVTATVGYLQGIGVGLLSAIVLFVINYSQLAVTKRISSGAYYHSNVLRTPEETAILEAEGEQIYILELQGVIFFGTANKLLNQIRDIISCTEAQRITDKTLDPVRFVILDFRLVNGLDASAVLSFAKLRQLAAQEQVHLLFTNLSNNAADRLKQGDCLDEDDPLCHRFVDVDRALEWCEQQILQAHQIEHLEFAASDNTLRQYLKTVFFDPAQVDRLMSYLEICTLAENEYLFRQGDPFNGLYFVGSGQVSVVLELGDGQSKRIRTYTVGNTIGEMGLYRQTVRMASVIADKPSTVYFLSSEAFAQIESTDPLLASNIHRFIVNLLAERLDHREQELKNLLQSS